MRMFVVIITFHKERNRKGLLNTQEVAFGPFKTLREAETFNRKFPSKGCKHGDYLDGFLYKVIKPKV